MLAKAPFSSTDKAERELTFNLWLLPAKYAHMQQGSGQCFCGAGCMLPSLRGHAATHTGEQDLAVKKADLSTLSGAVQGSSIMESAT